MTTLDHRAIDVDNHYYEPLDAFTRHLDKNFRRRGVQIVQEGRRQTAIIGNKVNRFIPNPPTFDRSSCLAASTRCSADRYPKASTRPP